MIFASSSLAQPTLPQSRKRQRPSFCRNDNLLPFQLTHRDQQILLRVAYYGILTTHQIEALIFHRLGAAHSLKSQCQRRLQLLFHHRFLNRMQQPMLLGEGRKPIIYTLALRGAKAVAQLLNTHSLADDWYPKQTCRTDPYQLEHDLAIGDTWVILDRLVQNQRIQMPYWLTQRHLRSGKFKNQLPTVNISGRRKSKVPDGYFAIQFPHASPLAHCFYEEDRGTETQKQWTEKISAYLNFRQSGASYTHFGCRNFRILAKTTTARRLAHLKHWTAMAGGNVSFWFTTQDRLSIWQPQTFLDSIWQVTTTDGDYALTLTDATALQS